MEYYKFNIFPKYYAAKIYFLDLLVAIFFISVVAQDANQFFPQIIGKCSYGNVKFDSCIKNVMNDLRQFFKSGIPEYNIRPFDPHRAAFVEQKRGDNNNFLGYKLILRNVSEYGWTNSEVTKYKTDPVGSRIIYSQYFPEKSLDGFYEFSGLLMGNPVKRKGVWNLTLYDYSQTTTVKRLGGPGSTLKVNVVVDKIGGMNLHISDFFGRDQTTLNNMADVLINSMWQVGLPVVKPLINDLVSTAFTDIFNKSFRYFPFENFLN